jgi:hypothetical protein
VTRATDGAPRELATRFSSLPEVNYISVNGNFNVCFGACSEKTTRRALGVAQRAKKNELRAVHCCQPHQAHLGL